MIPGRPGQGRVTAILFQEQHLALLYVVSVNYPVKVYAACNRATSGILAIPDDCITTGFHLTIDQHPDALPQYVEHLAAYISGTGWRKAYVGCWVEWIGVVLIKCKAEWKDMWNFR